MTFVFEDAKRSLFISGEDHEEHLEMNQITTAVVIVLVLIFLTIAFEKSKEAVEHRANQLLDCHSDGMFLGFDKDGGIAEGAICGWRRSCGDNGLVIFGSVGIDFGYGISGSAGILVAIPGVRKRAQKKELGQVADGPRLCSGSTARRTPCDRRS